VGGGEGPRVVLCSRNPDTAIFASAAMSVLGISRVLPRPCRLEAIGEAVDGLCASRRAAARQADAPSPGRAA
jgi:hypothetical protein